MCYQSPNKKEETKRKEKNKNKKKEINKKEGRAGVVAQACNPSTREGRQKDLKLEVSLGLISKK
jgi:hypothetical protein